VRNKTFEYIIFVRNWMILFDQIWKKSVWHESWKPWFRAPNKLIPAQSWLKHTI